MDKFKKKLLKKINRRSENTKKDIEDLVLKLQKIEAHLFLFPGDYQAKFALRKVRDNFFRRSLHHLLLQRRRETGIIMMHIASLAKQ